jgi:hypothetical protein
MYRLSLHRQEMLASTSALRVGHMCSPRAECRRIYYRAACIAGWPAPPLRLNTQVNPAALLFFAFLRA